MTKSVRDLGVEELMGEIGDWRKKMDELDLKLVKLLNERCSCALEIGKIKKKLHIDIYDPNREEQVIGNVQDVAQGPLTKKAMRRLFERIIDESRRAERTSRTSTNNRLRKSNKTKQASKEE